MNIERLSCFALELPLPEGGYTMSHGRHFTKLDTTIVELEAEDGTTGYGEVCGIGANYIDAYPAGVRAVIRELSPVIVGAPIPGPNVLEKAMDDAVIGNMGGKSAIDAAVWDMRGKILGQPVSALLGGVQQECYPLFYPIALREPQAMAAEVEEARSQGYRRWQLKLGNEPLTDAERLRAVLGAAGSEADFVTSDANGGWTPAQAEKFMVSIMGLQTFVEQPCETINQLSDLRSRFPFPMVIDEAVRDLHDLASCICLRAADAINIKPARLGGLTRAARLRDVAERLGLMVMVDDAMGGDIATAAVSHLAATSRPDRFLGASHLSAFSTLHVVSSGGAILQPPTACVPKGPGLGIEINRQALGEPLFSVSVPH